MVNGHFHREMLEADVSANFDEEDSDVGRRDEERRRRSLAEVQQRSVRLVTDAIMSSIAGAVARRRANLPDTLFDAQGEKEGEDASGL